LRGVCKKYLFLLNVNDNNTADENAPLKKV